MARDGLVRMEVDTHWAYHRKWRALQREHPGTWPTMAVAWFALLGEAWASRTRNVTLDDAWPSGLDPEQLPMVKPALQRVGLLDRAGRIPRDSWDEWFGPTQRRVDAGRQAAAVRWGTPTQSGGTPVPNAMALPIVSNRERSNREGERGERGGRGSTDRKRSGSTTGPTPMRDAMAAAGFDPEKLPKGG